MNSFFKYWFPVILWAGLIFTLSSVPSLKSELPSSWDMILRKIAHGLEYAIFAILLARAFNQSGGFVWYDALFVVMIVFWYAVSDEIHQASVFARHGSFWDVCLDTIGGIFGTLTAWKFYATQKQKTD